MNAARIALALNGKRNGNVYLCHCPVPSHGQGRGDRNPSLSIAEGDDRLLVRCFGGCDPRDVLNALRRRGLLREDRCDRRHQIPTEPDNTADRVRLARRLWGSRQPTAGTPAERYLRDCRGYAGPIPSTVAYMPARGEHVHAMIAAFGIANEPQPSLLAITDGAVRAVHLTRLAPDGRGKAEIENPKIAVGRPSGLPIVLAPPNDLLGLVITEGIEDALSMHEATGLGAWAAGSAPFLPSLADGVPPYAESVTVCVDDDHAGWKHASELVRRLRDRGFEVMPRVLRSPGITV